MIQNIKIGQLVRMNQKYANVFLSYNIDFCCGGNRTLEEAILECGANRTEVIAALESSVEEKITNLNFDNLNFEELINHIISFHHEYIYKESDKTLQLLNKVVKVHLESHPELLRVQEITTHIIDELLLHQRKEENILFPYIIAMDHAKANHEQVPDSCFGDIRNPIRAMEADHVATGNILMELKAITNNFTPPADACNSYITTYSRLNDLFNNLIQHIHLENNILHPKAIERFNNK